MEIKKDIEGTKMVLKVSGRMDTNTAPDVEAAIKESIDNVTELVIDFSDLDYISSAGLRVLLSAQKIMNEKGTMVLTGVSEPIMEIFEVTGFSDILTIQ